MTVRMLSRTEHRGVCELLSLVMSGMQSHMEGTEDCSFLQSMLMEKRLHLLVKVHERLKGFVKRNPVPAQDNAEGLARELSGELQGPGASAECTELISLLSKPHFKGLLSVHDTVAQKDYDPTLSPLPNDIEEDHEDSVKIISLVKSEEPLGATIKRDESTGAIIVARIMKGGAADRSGLIHEGDELREVNGVPMEDKKPEEIIPILAQSQGAVTFIVIPGTKEELYINESKLFVRALFNYDPKEDPAIPCRDAGLGFRKGDILQILSQEDDTWWQARHHDDSTSWAGLIPSQQLQERRVTLQQPKVLFQPGRVKKQLTVVEAADYGAITGIHIAGLRRSFRLSRRNSSEAKFRSCELGTITTQTSTYLEVVQYRRDSKEGHRLVLLVGPAGVGVSELKRRLLISDPDHFSVVIPHTSREKRRREKDGMEYHFVSRQTFEKDILNHKFIEYGEHRGNYYGSSLDSVHKVIAEGKVCLLDVQPQTIKGLYTTEFKPYVVFVKPPPIEELCLSRRKAKVISCEEEKKPTKTFSEEDFEDMIGSADAIESQYGHLFEKVVVNGDIALVFNELKTALEKIEMETQWIPVEWTHSLQNAEGIMTPSTQENEGM